MIGINFGKYLEEEIIQELYRISDYLKDLLKRFDIKTHKKIFYDNIKKKFSSSTIEYLKEGKDAILILKLKISGYLFVLKIYNLKLEEIIHYALSVIEVNNYTSEPLLIKENIFIKIHILNIYAIAELSSKHTLIVQEFSENQNYLDFLKKTNLQVNLVKITWNFIHKNGFVIDYMPNNFNISYIKKSHFYIIEYLDLIFFNDPSFKILSNELALQAHEDNKLLNHELFNILERR